MASLLAILSLGVLIISIQSKDVSFEDINQIENLITKFEYSSGDFVNGKMTEQQLLDFYDENLTPDFTLDFVGIYEINGLENFKSGFINHLLQNKVLNNVPGAFNYITLTATDVVVRNNELVTSFDFATSTTPFELFEVLQFTNIWILTRDTKNEAFKLKELSFTLDIRFPDIPQDSQPIFTAHAAQQSANQNGKEIGRGFERLQQEFESAEMVATNAQQSADQNAKEIETLKQRIGRKKRYRNSDRGEGFERALIDENNMDDADLSYNGKDGGYRLTINLSEEMLINLWLMFIVILFANMVWCWYKQRNTKSNKPSIQL